MSRRTRLPISFGIVLVFTLLAMLLASPSWSQISCGKGDGPGKVWKHRTQDPNDPDKTLEWYCVDEAYFKIEVKCDEETTCFAKCVFDGGHNQPIFYPGSDGWDKVIWYNWDRANCGLTIDDTGRQRGETPQQHADRVRQLMLDNGCDFNCYTWTASENLVASDTGLGRLQAYRDGKLVDDRIIPAGRADTEFHENPFLAEDPAMHLDTALGQVSDTGTSMVEHFEDGVIEDRYKALPGTDPLALTNGSLLFNIVEEGDGLEISTDGMAHPACLVLDGMDLAPFSVGNGIGYLLEFDNGDSFDLQMYQTNSVRVKAVEKKSDGTETEVVRTIHGIDLDDISRVQIDWVPSEGTLLERIEVEIWTKDGKKIVKKFRSGLTHESGRTTAYKIRGLDITTDPPILIDSITFDDTHTDYVEGFVGDLTVASVDVINPERGFVMGEPAIIGIVARNQAGDVLPVREVELVASGAGGVFENPYGLLSEDGRTVSLTTDEAGTILATFTPTGSGTVKFHIIAEGGEVQATLRGRVKKGVGISKPDDEPIEPVTRSTDE